MFDLPLGYESCSKVKEAIIYIWILIKKSIRKILEKKRVEEKNRYKASLNREHDSTHNGKTMT